MMMQWYRDMGALKAGNRMSWETCFASDVVVLVRGYAYAQADLGCTFRFWQVRSNTPFRPLKCVNSGLGDRADVMMIPQSSGWHWISRMYRSQ